MNILILGATGMLGSMVYRYLKQNSNFNITGTARKKDNNQKKTFNKNREPVFHGYT